MMTWFWFAELAFALVAYLMLDGFELGVGMLTAFAGDARDEMIASIAPVWDGNGTWLVIAGTILFGAFPSVYSIVLPALYAPLCLMLAGLIMRGVAIEFRHKAARSRRIWDVLLFVGSLLASVMQGVCVGTYAHGLPVDQLRYAGNGFEWCSPFSFWCGVSLALGYALLGSGWLVLKGQRASQRIGRDAIARLAPITALFVLSILASTLLTETTVETRWLLHPLLFALPVAACATFLCAPAAARRDGASAYLFAAGGCIAMVLMLAASYLPFIVPFDLTLDAAAAPRASQTFMFWGAGLFVMPFIVFYTCIAYSVFRGRVSNDHAYH
ncbi:cytochrome d ubiquinol oxidase subunit II [Burkholderia sp. AU19243]|uniref:cytochrome d ubiquinol oxidase subunit II n=1 Tax=Burkholderia sp. AU19243 TaxID=2824810 RepID=UPI001B8DDBD0|nr:cytochrome d ubiquinol oxidase subunit II [Burkholderia sp. AU19243]MBR8145664.1 cytochrome d ubiquinol oxidase subunit II [Burkholderia vietnamiensis]MBR8366985.1 cytochrome d ubiquinol oxidase subunit II [Burkholderia sp. AU19243]